MAKDLEKQVEDLLAGWWNGGGYDVDRKDLMALIDAQTLKELEALRKKYEVFTWGHYDVFTPIDDSIAELKQRKGL